VEHEVQATGRLDAGRQILQEINVVWGMECRHGLLGGAYWPEHLQVAIQAVAHDEGMGHAYTMRLHGVAMAIVVVANLWLVEICHFALAARVHAAVLERILKLVGQVML